MQNSNSPSSDWYAHWFGAEYDALYGHRDNTQAQHQVQTLRPWLENLAQPILDLGCGAGRHLAALRQCNFQCIGMDLSSWLLHQCQSQNLPILRGDMFRLPFKTNSLGAVLSFFSSFGYFPHPSDDQKILEQMVSSIQIGGILYLDLPNKTKLVGELPRRTEEKRGNDLIIQDRTWDGECVVKRIDWHKQGQHQIFWERLRLYDLKTIEQRFKTLGMEVLEIFGDELGSPFAAEQSPRMSFIARKVRHDLAISTF